MNLLLARSYLIKETPEEEAVDVPLAIRHFDIQDPTKAWLMTWNTSRKI